MNKLLLNNQYGEKVIFETENELDMANFLYDNDSYLHLRYPNVGSIIKLSLDNGEVLRDTEIIKFIEEQLPEKTDKFKKSLLSDKGFFKKKFIQLGLLEKTEIKYIKKKLR